MTKMIIQCISRSHRHIDGLRQNRSKQGFSLVEVVLALGICSFAMIAIVGMIPVGLSTFKDAMNTTVQSQIVQRLAGDILVADYANLATADTYTYYNDQGAVLDDGNPPSLAYTAKISKPNAIVQPSESGAVTPGEKVTIQIARTPPGQTFDSVASTTPAQIYSYSVVVANGF